MPSGQSRFTAFRWLFVSLCAITLVSGCANSRGPVVTTEGKIAVKGGSVYYKIVGANRPGVPLLILHGGPGIPHDYLLPLSALANERPVIFYDQLGCGQSSRVLAASVLSDRPADASLWTIEHYVDELATVRKALRLDRVHIYGHSWGSMLAVDYLLRQNPDGVVSLTLAGPALSMERWVADQRVWLLELPKQTQEAIRKAEAAKDFDSPEYQSAVGAFYAEHVCRLNPWPEYVQRALLPENMGQDIYLHMCGPSEFTITGSLKDYERVDRLAEITTPTLFICGRYDEATPAATEFYHRNLPGSHFKVIENASHLAYAEQPQAYNRVLRAFLKQVEADASKYKR